MNFRTFAYCLIALCILAQPIVAGCSTTEQTAGDDDDIAQDDDDDDAVATDDDDDAPHEGPAYRSCVSEAQCDPGSACTSIPGFGGKYCSPACDPEGDGAECALPGLPFATQCLEIGRCARHCADDEEPVPLDEDPPDDPREPDDPRCPLELTCRSVDEDALCAGIAAGISGYYGICSHTNVDGPDCPAASSCFGGGLVGSASGICLPWCDDGSCPDAGLGAVGTTPYCYDATDRVDLGHPICALLCTAGSGSSTCPDGQSCLDLGLGGVGLCSPPDATSPFL